MLYFWGVSIAKHMEKHPIELHGNWEWGVALDLHTKASFPIFDEENRIVGWNTIRTEIGEQLYKLKYVDEPIAQKKRRAEGLAREMADAIFWLWDSLSTQVEIDKNEWRLLSVPPSKKRSFQPVEEIKSALMDIIGLSSSIFIRKKDYKELKNIDDEQERIQALWNAFDVVDGGLEGKNVIVIDDLYRSGATLEAVTRVLKTQGCAKNVFVITLTKTRTKR